MNGDFRPKGRRGIPDELLKFGRHLVYSEGTKTEPLYVENIKGRIADKYLCNPNEIAIVPIKGNKSHNTVDLLEYALRDVAERLAAREKIDHVWLMFDKDDFPRFDEANRKIAGLNDSETENSDGFRYEKATEISWHSCWSNESFELWLCLYFSFYTSANSRKDYIMHLEQSTPLKKIGFEYEKNMTGIHDILEQNGGSVDRAIRFAKKLHDENGTGNPSTGMYVFADYFRKYMIS